MMNLFLPYFDHSQMRFSCIEWVIGIEQQTEPVLTCLWVRVNLYPWIHTSAKFDNYQQ